MMNLGIFTLLFFGSVVAGLKRETRDTHYFIALKKNSVDVLSTLHLYKPLVGPEGKFYADPILVKHQETQYLFFEEYDYVKGVISYVTFDSEMNFSPVKKVLELPIHLSFPSIFQKDGEIYMIPETYDARSVSLFRAIDFPDKWEFTRTLVKGNFYADPQLIYHDGYYYLFTAIDQDKLQIYYATDLEASFKAHPINARQVRGRNAGLVFSQQGHLIRPVMDCSSEYGKAVILKQIVLLSPSRFIEKQVVRIEPTWALGLDGTHSYSQNEEYVVYDGRVLKRTGS